MHAAFVRILLALCAVVSLASATAPADTTPALSSSLIARHHGYHTSMRAHHARRAQHHRKKGHKSKGGKKHVRKGGRKHVRKGGKKHVKGATLHHLSSSSCGSRSATSSISTGGGPNGAQSFFNCGIDGNGWKPPFLDLDSIKTVSLESKAAKDTFSACQKYSNTFEKYGKQFDIPPIMIAAIAMQESSCNANTMGDNGGAFGLMQITKDKCGGAPGGDCRDVEFNIRVGAKTLKDCIDNANGNVLEGLASYNGWFSGMTHHDATAVASTECSWQQNLDYLQQMLNGWLLGENAYARHLGTEKNLARCGA